MVKIVSKKVSDDELNGTDFSNFYFFFKFFCASRNSVPWEELFLLPLLSIHSNLFICVNNLDLKVSSCKIM